MAHPPGRAAQRRFTGVSGDGFQDVAAVSAVPEGELLGAVLPDGTPVCLYNHRGVIGAVSDVCTHNEFAMSDGVLHGDGTLECMWHGARFDCRTGAVRRAPATEPLAVFPVRVDSGRISVGPRVLSSQERRS